MEKYKYMNESEKRKTQPYEGIYTPEEIELHKKLYEECSKKHIDFVAIEDLLKQGAIRLELRRLTVGMLLNMSMLKLCLRV